MNPFEKIRRSVNPKKKKYFLRYVFLMSILKIKRMHIHKKGSTKNDSIFDKIKNTLLNMFIFAQIKYFKKLQKRNS